MEISLQIVELWGVGGFRPGLTDFKKPGLNRVKKLNKVSSNYRSKYEDSCETPDINTEKINRRI